MFSAELTFRTLKLDEAAFQAARHILHIDASHGASSVIGHGARALFAALDPNLHVDHLRLWEEPLRARLDYNLHHVHSKLAMLAGNGTDVDVQHFTHIEEFAAQVATAGGLVVSAPMWNYGVPWVLKQYFDLVLHPGLTFRETASGPQGLLGSGRPLVLLTSSGGAAAKDHLTPWLLDVAAMLGFDRPLVVASPNVAHGERQQVLEDMAARSAGAAAHLGSGGQHHAGAAAAQEETEPMTEWDHERVLEWLRMQDKLSVDALESLEAARINAELFCQASEEDWRHEELGLEDSDVVQVLDLQRAFLEAAQRSPP